MKSRLVKTSVYRGEVVRSVHIEWDGEVGYDYYIMPNRALKKAERKIAATSLMGDRELVEIAVGLAFPGECLSEVQSGPGRFFRSRPSILRYGRHVVVCSRWGIDI